jgi:hypothetical protein
MRRGAQLVAERPRNPGSGRAQLAALLVVIQATNQMFCAPFPSRRKGSGLLDINSLPAEKRNSPKVANGWGVPVVINIRIRNQAETKDIMKVFAFPKSEP